MIRPGAVLKALRPGMEWTLTDSTNPVVANLVIHSDEPAITQAEYDEMAAQMEAAEPWIDIRAERDQLLRASDFTRLSDAPFSTAKKAQWKTYRQTLRDLPQTYDNIEDVEWPEAPSG